MLFRFIESTDKFSLSTDIHIKCMIKWQVHTLNSDVFFNKRLICKTSLVLHQNGKALNSKNKSKCIDGVDAILLKFRYSEKAATIWPISHLNLKKMSGKWAKFLRPPQNDYHCGGFLQKNIANWIWVSTKKQNLKSKSKWVCSKKIQW